MLARRTFLQTASAAALAGIPRFATAQTAPVVRFATSGAESYAQPFYAQDAGIFAKAGLTVEIQTLANGASVSTAVAGGAFDFGVTTIVNIANAVLRGVPFVMIAPAALDTPTVQTGQLCVAAASPFRAAKDFEGKAIAIPALKQVADVAVRAWLAKGGADLSKVQIVETSFADMAPGLARGTFGGATISEPVLSYELKHGTVRVIPGLFQTIAPRYVLAGWVTTSGFAQKNPEIVRKVAACLMESARWANSHHNETAVIAARVTKGDVEAIRNEARPVYGESINLVEIQPHLDAAYKFGFLSRPVTAAEIMWH
jgi:NitT/TauT family transport system substrate-binding protein